MNNLESLKQKMMVKPNVSKKEQITVNIRPQKKTEGNKTRKIRNNQNIQLSNQEENKEESQPEVEEPEVVTEDETSIHPQIIDLTSQPFDRASILNKIKGSDSKPIPIQSTQPPQPTQLQKSPSLPKSSNTNNVTRKRRPVKLGKKRLLTIEEGEDEDKTSTLKPTQPSDSDIIPKDQADINPIPPQDSALVKVTTEKKAPRITRPVEKGIAVIGPEMASILDGTNVYERLPHKPNPVLIKSPTYYMNNREIFVNFINSVFLPYKQEIDNNQDEISCDNIGKTNSEFSLLTHQKIVRDYMNLFTPYRGLLLFHGLGSGKTASSIAIAEGMKDSKKIIVMTPASLRSNYIEELKKAGDLLYKKNQYWEWISTDVDPKLVTTLSAILNIKQEFIRKQKGAWLVNVKKASNLNDLSDAEIKSIDLQINEMIFNKYTFINYNGLNKKKLSELTNQYKNNLFDNAVVIIDEAHNLISRIVNKLSKEKEIKTDVRGELEHLPTNLATKLYEYLLSAKNARIILLSGTPVINYPNEFAILFNILRGYIKTWKFPLKINNTGKVDKNFMEKIFLPEKSHDYIDYSPTSKILTITKNPYGFKNKIKKSGEYQGVSNSKKDDLGKFMIEADIVSDEDFERKIISILKKNDIEIASTVSIKFNKALPDKLDQFMNYYLDDNGKLKNVDALKRRIIGLSSYFKSAQENLLPTFEKQLGKDYHIIRIPMSNLQFKIYESARIEERKLEKPKKKKQIAGEDLKEHSSTYKIFSRLFCNYVIPNRPLPKEIRFEQTLKNNNNNNYKNDIKDTLRQHSLSRFNELMTTAKNDKEKQKITQKFEETLEKATDFINKLVVTKKNNLKSPKKPKLPLNVVDDEIIDSTTILVQKQNQDDDQIEEIETQQTEKVKTLLNDANNISKKNNNLEQENTEIEGDELIAELGGDEYKKRVEEVLELLKNNPETYLLPNALETYSPKFLHMLENIKDPEFIGNHLVYSQFRTLEGIGIFSLVLEANGFIKFSIKKNENGTWKINIPDELRGQPAYALYTGTETTEEKEIIRHIYNGEWHLVPDSIASELKKIANNNNLGEIIKVFMITSSGSEGINLTNTRYVHIMEPYWHPVRTEQVIGRARRICSHKNLPKHLQTVEVYFYLMEFTADQLKSDEAVELKRKDLSRRPPYVPLSSDQNLFEISEIKANINSQLIDVVKETSFDCYIYSNGKCINFGNPSNDKFSFVPDFAEQQGDSTSRANKTTIEWTGKPINILGIDYVYRRVNPKLLNIYDKKSYESALKDPSIVPLQIGTVEINEKGQEVFKQIGQ